MKKAWLAIPVMVLVLTVIAGCGTGAVPEGEGDFNFTLRYGIMAKNEINTFEGTVTKDMVTERPIKINLRLTEAEMKAIYRKMVEIDFFSYPEVFRIEVPADSPTHLVTPASSYFFTVQYDSQTKRVRWIDDTLNPDIKADRLRELILYIRGIVENKKEYRELPPARGGYF
jgi:hypothetical protein